jgi:hypothetical protein
LDIITLATESLQYNDTTPTTRHPLAKLSVGKQHLHWQHWQYQHSHFVSFSAYWTGVATMPRTIDKTADSPRYFRRALQDGSVVSVTFFAAVSSSSPVGSSGKVLTTSSFRRGRADSAKD